MKPASCPYHKHFRVAQLAVPPGAFANDEWATEWHL